MMKLLSLFIGLMLCLLHSTKAQDSKFSPSDVEIKQMNEAMQADTNLSKVLKWFGEPEALYTEYKRNLHKADSIWQSDQKSLSLMDIGVTKKFEMIPLIDWFTANEGLIGEGGVAYLIKTDEATILFDLGANIHDGDPSPLLQNMNKLGITIDEIDMIVISHNHGDHTGGGKWQQKNTFSFTNYQLELNEVPVYTPVEMTYPGLHPTHTQKPTRIAKGVATIGVIHKPMFVLDIAEQSLAINVKGKGIVIISGCGHQSMRNIVERKNTLFKEPLYAVLGGFHYPVEESRNISWIYKYFVVDKLPWERLTTEDISYNIDLLKNTGVKVVGISGHDSCDKSIGMFKEEFGDNFIDIVVGEKVAFKE